MGRLSEVKYLEEIETGQSITFEDNNYIVTSDYKRNGSRLCVNLRTGFSKWIASNDIVGVCPIYILDENNNISPIKPDSKTNV